LLRACPKAWLTRSRPFLNLLRVGADLVAGGVGQIRVEPANQGLTHVGVQLGFEQCAMRIGAGQNPFLEHAFFQQVLQRFRDMFEMLTSLVFHAALGVASVIAGISVTAAFARQRLEQVFAFRQFAEAKIEDAGPVPVDEHNAQQRRGTQQMGNRFEMKMAVDEELRTGEAGGQIILPPEVLGGASKHSFAVSSIAAQFAREAQDAVHIGAGGVFLLLIFHGAESFAHQVLDQNRVFLMRLVARRGWLEIKTDSTTFFILKFS
jgi:hypothetical protein